MLTSFLRDARRWPERWRSRFNWWWLTSGQEHLPFLGIIGLPILGVAAIVFFAYVNGTRVEPQRIHALEREALRAQRRADDLQCLAENIYFEARGEPLDGQYAVAEVTLNRTRAQQFPHTICGVVHQSRWDPNRRRVVGAFSWTELGDLSPGDGPAWKRAKAVANAAYEDEHESIVPGALFYHATSVRPGWASSRAAIATIGNHVFYR